MPGQDWDSGSVVLYSVYSVHTHLSLVRPVFVDVPVVAQVDVKRACAPMAAQASRSCPACLPVNEGASALRASERWLY